MGITLLFISFQNPKIEALGDSLQVERQSLAINREPIK